MSEPFQENYKRTQKPKWWQRLRDQAGATMVEFAIVAVLFFAIVTLIAQGGLLFSAWLGITNGAREGARFGAPCINRTIEGCSINQIKAKVLQTTQGFLDQTRMTTSVMTSTTELTVTVQYTAPSVTPWMGELPLSAQSVMRLEIQDPSWN